MDYPSVRAFGKRAEQGNLEGHIGAGERVEDSASDGWRRWGRRLGADSQRGRNESSHDKESKTQLVVICGRSNLKRTFARARTSNVVVVRGFVDNIHEYMGACDCLVEAGPGTIAEAMTRGLPIVLSSFLPGQEAGNV